LQALGLTYANGEGVPQDYVLAHMWFNLAEARSNHPMMEKIAGELRDETAKRMTPAQIAEAQKLAREWQSKRP
jgi:TPR repeat protein